MADTSPHPDFDLDTALSADLDGELDAYASELGVGVADVRAALTGPAADLRREELAAVRAAVHDEPVAPDPLDDVTRRRLLAGAGVGTARSAPRRERGRLLRPAAAAAVTLLVLGGGYAILRDSGGSGGSAAKSGAGGDSTAAVAVTGDLGDVGTIDAAEIAGFLQGKAVRSEATKAADRAAQAGDGAAFAEASPQAVAGCASQYAAEGTIRFRASGTYGNRPAVVLGIDTPDRTIVFVVAADECTQVLYSASR